MPRALVRLRRALLNASIGQRAQHIYKSLNTGRHPKDDTLRPHFYALLIRTIVENSVVVRTLDSYDSGPTHKP
jgi:hypothetical protein